jgi:hypothetical protein
MEGGQLVFVGGGKNLIFKGHGQHNCLVVVIKNIIFTAASVCMPMTFMFASSTPPLTLLHIATCDNSKCFSATDQTVP